MADHRISPTAYATGYFWYQHGLAPDVLATARGHRLNTGFGLLSRLTGLLGGVSLEALMLARHAGIDAVLEEAIEAGRIAQVIELAAGLSGRGWRLCQRYPQLVYVETDLYPMAALKREKLGAAGLLGERHRVEAVDALQASGPGSLAALAATLDPRQGVAIITEGLMNYLAPDDARRLWQRIATTLDGFEHGLYTADVYLGSDNRSAAFAAFGAALAVFVRHPVYFHFQREAELVSSMHDFGFSEAQLLPAPIPAGVGADAEKGAQRVRILAARARAGTGTGGR